MNKYAQLYKQGFAIQPWMIPAGAALAGAGVGAMADKKNRLRGAGIGAALGGGAGYLGQMGWNAMHPAVISAPTSTPTQPLSTIPAPQQAPLGAAERVQIAESVGRAAPGTAGAENAKNLALMSLTPKQLADAGFRLTQQGQLEVIPTPAIAQQ